MIYNVIYEKILKNSRYVDENVVKKKNDQIFQSNIKIFLSLTLKFYLGKNPLLHAFKNQISSLFISFNDEDNSLPSRATMVVYTQIFGKILTIFTNLRCLRFNPSACPDDSPFIQFLPRTIFPTLLELHTSVETTNEFLYLFAGRFDQLRILYVNVFYLSYWCLDKEHKKVDFFINILYK
jgi:hypothetical protein